MAALAYSQCREADASSLAAMLSQSFHFPDDEAKKFVTKAGRQARVVKDGDEVVAGLVGEVRMVTGVEIFRDIFLQLKDGSGATVNSDMGTPKRSVISRSMASGSRSIACHFSRSIR